MSDGVICFHKNADNPHTMLITGYSEYYESLCGRACKGRDVTADESKVTCPRCLQNNHFIRTDPTRRVFCKWDGPWPGNDVRHLWVGVKVQGYSPTILFNAYCYPLGEPVLWEINCGDSVRYKFTGTEDDMKHDVMSTMRELVVGALRELDRMMGNAP